jgi:8-oxo-dGTP pyrophosphatase MutT (NUDIX family)/GNAT superfamily N-acetyltransferase
VAVPGIVLGRGYNPGVHIRPATAGDHDRLWAIFHAVVAGRDTYAFSPDTPRHEGIVYWFGPAVTSFVAEINADVVGVYKLIDNCRDLGAHVANASFMVDPAAAGLGVGRALGAHCLREARAIGYDAMQFNFVISTNDRAVRLWQALGFQIAGTLPRAFQHGTLGLVDAYVMHRFLDDIVLTFGQPPRDVQVTVRPSGYAVIADDRRRVAVVDATEGTLLPGGGIDSGETVDDAVVREVDEECGLQVEAEASLGDAVQFVYSAKTATHFEKPSRFVTASRRGAGGRAGEHATRWLEPREAERALSYESHAWAVRRWARLNM